MPICSPNVAIRDATSTLTAIPGRTAMDLGHTLAWDEMICSG